MTYVAAFDAGTTAVKGTLVSETGEAVLTRSVELSVICRDGFQEQAPQDWWTAFCDISRQFTQAVPKEAVSGIIMSGQMQDLIPLDADLSPVCPAILYSDGRAGDQAAALEREVGGDYFLRATGNRCDGSLPLPKLMWLRKTARSCTPGRPTS